MVLSEKNKEKQFFYKVKWVVGVPVVAAALLFICCFMARQYRFLSATTVNGISSIYMQEVTDQLGSHFQTNLDSQFAQLDTVFYALEGSGLPDEGTVQAVLADLQQKNDFSHLALIDDSGMIHSVDGVFPGFSKISELSSLLNGKEQLVSFNETIWDDNVLLLGKAIDKIEASSGTFVAVIAGIDSSAIVRKLTLDKKDGEIHAAVLDNTGAALIHESRRDGWQINQNLFSALSSAEFDEGYSYERMKEDFRLDREGMQIARLPDEHLIFYYCPVQNTEWFVCTYISVPVVETPIWKLNRFILFTVTCLSVTALVVIAAFFLLNLKNERIHSRRLKEERDRANAATAAKSRFLSQMSHEIRTPMNGIIGLAELARRCAKNNPQVLLYLNEQEQISANLLAIINDVLDVSRIESGRIEIAHENFNLIRVLSGIATTYGVYAEEKGIKFDIFHEGRMDEVYNGDELRLTQILGNLCSNATKFTPERGSIRIEFRKLEREGAEWISFTVADTGCGIAPENQERIFEAFEQETVSTVSRYGGTGLGLSIVKNFVRLMGGEISLESQLGEGSHFTVKLPFGKVKEQPVYRDYSDKHFLAAFSEPESLDCMVDALLGFGAEVDAASTIKEAEMLLARNRYDACITSVQMLRQGLPTATVPVMLRCIPHTATDELAREKKIVSLISIPSLGFNLNEALTALERGETVTLAEAEQSVDFTGMHILLAEDNEINRMIANELISSTGAEVENAKDGVEAVDCFAASSAGYFDLILMDIQMPNMDGLQATKLIRDMDRGDAKTVVIYAMSANAFPEDVEQSLASGMNGHWPKPIELKGLMSALQTVYDSRKRTNGT
ncbi:ATP-binding protein [Eisenbergiella sp.]